MTKHCELQLDRSLLDANFDGYKVSMDDVHFSSKKLEQICPPRKPSQKMHTLQHMLVFSHQNQLFFDEISSNNGETEHIFRILDTGHIQSIIYHKKVRIWSESIVGSVKNASKNAETYPPSLFFTEKSLAIASNGAAEIAVFLVVSPQNWVKMLEFRPAESAETVVSLLEARVIDGTLRVLAQNVGDSGRNRVFHAHIRLDDVDTAETLIVERIDEFTVGGCLETCTLSETGEEIVFFASQKPYLAGKEPQNVVYTWEKKGNTVKIEFELPENMKIDDVVCDVKAPGREVYVSVGDVTLLDGHFFAEIETCSLTSEEKQVTLELVTSEKDEEKTWDRLLVEEEKRRARGASVSCGEELEGAEECDEAEIAYSFFWIDVHTGMTVKQCDASGRQVLFTRHSGRRPALFCLRHDVDGVIWALDDADTSPSHVATLQAFGYVQASKTARVWSGSSTPGHKYAGIAEQRHRVLIYSQKVEVAGALSNRKTATAVSHVAKQHLLRLECPEPICGVHLTDELLFVLTTQHVHVAELDF